MKFFALFWRNAPPQKQHKTWGVAVDLSSFGHQQRKGTRAPRSFALVVDGSSLSAGQGSAQRGGGIRSASIGQVWAPPKSSYETIVSWYLQGNRIMPWFRQLCRISSIRTMIGFLWFPLEISTQRCPGIRTFGLVWAPFVGLKKRGHPEGKNNLPGVPLFWYTPTSRQN